MPNVILKRDVAYLKKIAPYVAGLLVLLFIGVVAFLAYVNVQNNRRLDLLCKDNLQNIGFALHTYESLEAKLPGWNWARKRSPPGLSWRVGVCQYLEGSYDDQRNYSDVYFLFDTSEPWDSEKNLKLATERPPPYACPTVAMRSRKRATYFAVTGSDTCWPDDDGIKFSEVSDGLSNTALIAESHDLQGAWSQPQDLEFSRMRDSIGGSQGSGLSSSHSGGAQANIAMADGGVRTLSARIDPQVLKQLFNRRDGMPVDNASW